MSFSKSMFAFDDVKPTLDRALEAEKGIKVVCNNYGHAIITRSRFHYYRQMDREQNAKNYPPEHPLWNRSVYDKLILRVPKKGAPDAHCLYVEKRRAEDFQVEEIE